MWVIKADAAAPLPRVPLSLAASDQPLEMQEVMTQGPGSWGKIPLKDPGSNAGGVYSQRRGPGRRLGGGGARGRSQAEEAQPAASPWLIANRS